MRKLPFVDELDSCPKCGSLAGYEKTAYVAGTVTDFISFDGTFIGMTDDPYNHLREVRQHKIVKCIDCKKSIARLRKMS